jgi:hypothetical protein
LVKPPFGTNVRVIRAVFPLSGIYSKQLDIEAESIDLRAL